MGFRYRRTVRVSKNTKLNVGTQKASVSLGQPGLTVNVSRRGARATFGLPGTGLSYVTKQTGGSRKRASLIEELLFAIFVVFLLGAVRLIWRGVVGTVRAVLPRKNSGMHPTGTLPPPASEAERTANSE
jgi:hypothetical protein